MSAEISVMLVKEALVVWLAGNMAFLFFASGMAYFFPGTMRGPEYENVWHYMFDHFIEGVMWIVFFPSMASVILIENALDRAEHITYEVRRE